MADILIDDREGSRRLIRYAPLRDLAVMCRLSSGDVAFTGNGPDDTIVTVGIEVKSIYDLIGSMGTKRLQGQQLPALIATYDVRWLLYYGSYRAGTDGRLEIRQGPRWRPYRIGSRYVPYGYVESMLFTVTSVGVHVRHVYDETEGAAWLACLYRWWSKPWQAHRGFHATYNSQRTSLMPSLPDGLRRRVQVAQALPGIGYERAVAAARYFPTITAMINATEDDWGQVPGVGKVVSRAVAGAVRSTDD